MTPTTKSTDAGKTRLAGIEPARDDAQNGGLSRGKARKTSIFSKSGPLIYFIGGGDLVKIGWAADPMRRMDDLQTGSPVRLKLLGFYPGGLAMERALHARFSAARAHGEWFDPAKMRGLFLEIARAQQYAEAFVARAV
jgi:hypothetical protein